MPGTLIEGWEHSCEEDNYPPTWDLCSSHHNLKWVRSLRERVGCVGKKTKGRTLRNVNRLRGTEKK